MSKVTRLLLFLLALSVVACGSSEGTVPAENAGPRTVSVDSSEVGLGTEEEPAVADNELALEPGLYVADGTDCGNPPNTGFRVWTGQGLEGSSTEGCRFTVSSREGEVYKGRQSCANTGTGSRTTTELSIEVLEPGSIVLTEADEATHYTLCPESEVPEWVGDRLR